MATPQDEVAQWTEKVLQVLEADGSIDKMRQLIRNHVAKSNWREQVKQMSMQYMSPDLIEDATPESIAEKIHQDALNALPPDTQKELENFIRESLTNKMVPVQQKE